MTFVYNDTTEDAQGLVQHLRFLSGLDSLGIADITRLFNFALEDYSYIAITSSGRWKFDDSTHVDDEGDKTFPIATATLGASDISIPLATSFVTIEKVLFNGKILKPIDQRDFQTQTPEELYGTSGTPERYDYDSHSLFFYPYGVSGTVKVFHTRSSPHFSVADGAVTIGIPSAHHLYLVHHAMRQLGFRTDDANKVDIKEEMEKWEGREGSGGKIRDYYNRRDQTTGRRLRAKINVPR